MTPHELIANWRDAGLRERQGAQEWFLDLCRLVGHPTPAAINRRLMSAGLMGERVAGGG